MANATQQVVFGAEAWYVTATAILSWTPGPCIRWTNGALKQNLQYPKSVFRMALLGATVTCITQTALRLVLTTCPFLKMHPLQVLLLPENRRSKLRRVSHLFLMAAAWTARASYGWHCS